MCIYELVTGGCPNRETPFYASRELPLLARKLHLIKVGRWVVGSSVNCCRLPANELCFYSFVCNPLIASLTNPEQKNYDIWNIRVFA